MASSATRHKLGDRIEGLDLLRGFALALVLVHHSWITFFGAGGIVGVLIFFTLSGYLITGLLMGDLRNYGRIRYARFYRNRALRLLPALYVLLAGLVLVTLTIDPRNERDALLGGVLVSAFYVANLPLGVDFFTVVHMWTLSTEEQFYLVWPVVLAVGVRLRILKWMVALAGLAIMGMVFLTLQVANIPAEIYPLPSSWSVAMVVGAGARLGQERIARLLPAPGGVAFRLLQLVVLAVLLGMCLLPLPDNHAISYTVGGPLVSALSVVLIFGAREWKTIPTPALRPLLALGKVSYAAYLWNWPIAFWLGVDTNHTVAPVLAIVLTFAAAAVSWWVVERPIALWRARMNERDPRHVTPETVVSAESRRG
ncbi:acyltransferase family protein [Nocardioides cavernaquae]|uniref:acyltransferase family protein n=1 Tax=Nocardioides cavernaquae TaxID=2321396 RepID=UPI0016044207|nr:acyltransferase [Nocardioides cavernaquae]